MQKNCITVGFNAGNKAKVRIGVVGNEQSDCDSPDSLIGIGGSVGDFGISGLACGTFSETSAPCGNKYLRDWGFVFVR